MRTILPLNRKWFFRKNITVPPDAVDPAWDLVNLPHTWNGLDGQDGGGDFWRGTACYLKSVSRAELPEGDRILLDIPAANASADVYVNGRHICRHDGGYSAFRPDITDALADSNLICILVDNGKNDRVYPQNADFTFYGGLYRGLNVLGVPAAHLDTETDGNPGLHAVPRLSGSRAEVSLRTALIGDPAGLTFRFLIRDAEGGTVAETETDRPEAVLTVERVHRWHGRRDPYLYTAEVQLLERGAPVDRVSVRFGCREFVIDPERGFLLNGESYPLRGVCRHQDRPDIGNALLPCHHEEDMDLICEMGANTIRLAHYQQSEYFYSLCDERGLVVWAEIPYISAHMDHGRANTLSQLTELIRQNDNHPSIAVWGLSNEITMMTPHSADMLENHRLLQELAHRLDPTRPTVMACVSMCSIDDPMAHISDVVSYNLYFGWYDGTVDMNGPWLDAWHEKYPETPIGVSEYGADSLNWHTGNPHQGDYSEEYEAWYHEQIIPQFFSRPYVWATHVWNMFDFAADGRSEGGESGINHKGLVTFDRKYRKDAFYAYKAWLSEEPFVRIGGKRYVDRVENPAHVTVYSNQPEVELLANGRSLGKKTAADHFFRFEVPNEGETHLEARAGACRDESFLRHVDTPNPAYILREEGVVLSWQEVTEEPGCYSLNDTLGDLQKSPEAWALVEEGVMAKLPPREGSDQEAMRELMKTFTVIRLIRITRAPLEKDDLLELNRRLNGIAKP